jgi:septal ring factor EnvC (AmiA/AmiB activator)
VSERSLTPELEKRIRAYVHRMEDDVGESDQGMLLAEIDRLREQLAASENKLAGAEHAVQDCASTLRKVEAEAQKYREALEDLIYALPSSEFESPLRIARDKAVTILKAEKRKHQ